MMACRRDGERCEWVDVCDVMKQFAKLQTTPSENIDVGTTVRYGLYFKVEHVVFLQRVVCHERFFIFWVHSVWIVVRRRRNGTDVILAFFLVEEMGEVTFREFFKVFGKLASFIGMNLNESMNWTLNIGDIHGSCLTY